MAYTIGNISLPQNTVSVTVPTGGYTLGPTGPTGSSGATWTTATSISPFPTSAKITANGKMELTGDDADLLINGQSLKETMQIIQDRLAILVPDPQKLEQFEALKQAYEHYKTLEALCCEQTTPKSDK